MKRIATVLAALALTPLPAPCGGESAAAANAPAPAPPVTAPPAETAESVVIPFNPPLDRPARYTLVNAPAGVSRDISFSLRFSVREGGFRMVIEEAGLPGGPPPIIAVVSRDGRIMEIENRAALVAHFEALWERQAAAVPAAERARRIRLLRALMMQTLTGDAMAGVYTPVLALAGARLARDRPIDRPIVFHEEFGAMSMPWRVRLEQVTADCATASAEASVDREQSLRQYALLAAVFRDADAGVSPEAMGWRSPATAEHHVQRAQARFRVSRRDGLVEHVDWEGVRERRDPGAVQATREVRRLVLRRIS